MHSIQDVLKTYFDTWNDAFKSKSDTHIRNFMSHHFRGYWSHSSLDEPENYDYHYDIISILHLYNDAKKSFEPISISERKEGEEVVVMGTETNELNHTLHQAKCMLIWRKENNEWKLLREYIELER